MTTTEPPPIATLIGEKRRQQGRSKRSLALEAEISAQYWTNIERGTAHPSPDVLARVAEVLWIDPGELTALGRPDAAHTLERRLSAAPQDLIRETARDAAGKIARARNLTKGAERKLADQIERAAKDITAPGS